LSGVAASKGRGTAAARKGIVFRRAKKVAQRIRVRQTAGQIVSRDKGCCSHVRRSSPEHYCEEDLAGQIRGAGRVSAKPDVDLESAILRKPDQDGDCLRSVSAKPGRSGCLGMAAATSCGL